MTLKYRAPNPDLYKSLLAAYDRCLENKRHIRRTTFHLNYEKIVYDLCLDIEDRVYRPGLSSIFIVLHPKPREIIAAHLRDRIVHHFVYDYMASYWERRFHPHSYACRPGKGPLQASQDLRRFINRHQRGSGGRPLWYLKLDIQNFFPSIDLNILYGLLAKHLKNPLYLWLMKVTIFHRATVKGEFQLNSPKELWKKIPKYKSLFAALPHKGLPIGNLTSQFLANVYLNQLDQFIARKLKGKFLYWQRYVDDVLCVGEDPRSLQECIEAVDEFLRTNLDVQLNAKKTLLQPLSRGLDHLGYFHLPNATLVRQRVVKNCKANLFQYVSGRKMVSDPVAFASSVNSYLGYFSRASSQKLRNKIGQTVVSAPLQGHVFELDRQSKKIKQKKDPAIGKEKGLREKALREKFSDSFDGKKPKDRERCQNYLKNWLPIEDLLAASQEVFFDGEGAKDRVT